MCPDIKNTEDVDEAEISKGNGNSSLNNQLSRIVSESDENKQKDGRLISAAINQGFSSFTPDMFFENLAKDFSLTKKMFGEKLLRFVTNYSPDYIKKNINIPEFKRELNSIIKRRFDDMYREGLVDYEGNFTEEGIKLAALVMYGEELDKLQIKGYLGNKTLKESSAYGVQEGFKSFKDNNFKDLDIKKTIRLAIRRAHKEIQKEDLVAKDIKQKGLISLVYAIDASGSMRGRKLEAAKKAGIALAFSSIEKRDKIGLIIFNEEIQNKIYPTLNFNEVLNNIAQAKPLGQTNLTKAIQTSLEMFPKGNLTKHLILITDAMPTIGDDPKKEVLKEISKLRELGINVSLIGINLDEESEELSKEIANIGKGRFFVVRDIEELDTIILDDYYSFR